MAIGHKGISSNRYKTAIQGDDIIVFFFLVLQQSGLNEDWEKLPKRARLPSKKTVVSLSFYWHISVMRISTSL